MGTPSVADSTCLTPGSIEPWEAATGKGAQSVQAAGAVHAGVGVALIDVDLAQAAAVAVGTLTPGGREEQLKAARWRRTLKYSEQRLQST